MYSVCKSLSQPDQEGLQTCIEWVEYSFFSELSPYLNFHNANLILASVAVVFATVFIIKRIMNLLGTYY